MTTIAEGLNFPTSLALSPDGRIFVGESGLPFAGAPPGGRVLEIVADGISHVILDGLRAPVNGITYDRGTLIISEGGHLGRISRHDLRTGDTAVLIDELPGFGNYQTNMVALGPDGRLYFSQGALTNSAVIGLDSHDMAWLQHVPHNCDVPGYRIVLADTAYSTGDPRQPGASATTGAFAPFGTTHPAGHVIEGRVPCTASVMSCAADGTDLRLVAWGMRNGYGLGFLPDGRLLATDQGADVRGSRPLGNCPDALYEVSAGAWYGWPDFVCGRPVTSPEFAVAGKTERFVLTDHDGLPPPERPLLEFPVNAAAVKFDVIPSGAAAFAGDVVVALFGDEKPLTAPAGAKVGRRLARLSVADWTMHHTPAIDLYRPIDVRFAADGTMYVVDFGHFEMGGEKGVSATAASGSVIRLSPDFLQEAA